MADSPREFLRRYRAKRRTVWIEHPDGGGHWASNWELNRG